MAVRKKAATKKAAPAKSRAVATRNSNTAVAKQSREIDYEADADSGFEGVDKECMAIPFLRILQALSPAVSEDLVEGARPGMFINSVTNALFEDGVDFIPVAFQRVYGRWIPRDEGGGYHGDFTPAEFNELERAGEITRNEDGFFIYGDEDIIDTRNHFVLFNNGSNWVPAVISLNKTGLKHSKRLMTIMDEVKFEGKGGKKFTPPTWANIYRATSQKETKDKNTWFNWNFELVERLEDVDLYDMAKDFHKRIIQGQVEVAPPVMDEVAGEDEDTSGRF